MASKKGGIIVAALACVFSFITVAYISCTKPGPNVHFCENFVCENGGRCYIDTLLKRAACVCPTGFEGYNCVTPIVNKYVGKWNVTQVILGSDSTGFDGDSTHYVANLTATATPTTFFINNFSGNPYYTYILCSIDSINNSQFVVDTISAQHMIYNSYKLLYGSGNIDSSHTLITATILVQHLSPTSNWIHDTIGLYMTPQ